ncbi:MAG: CPBP family intramembrane metalloprotease [Novosphingobium sp.]
MEGTIGGNARKPGPVRRFVAFPLTLMVIDMVSVVAAALLVARLGRMLPAYSRNSPITVLVAMAAALAVILVYKANKRWIERAPDRELAWSGALGELGTGLALGAGLFTVMTAAVGLMGGIVIEGVRGAGMIWAMLAMAIVSGVLEEVVFRGLIMRHLESLIGTWGALLLTSAFFGLAHILNPNATWFSSLAIMLEAGLLLGGAYLLTRRLWMAIGVHAAWNFTQGWVFSIPVSGSEPPLGLLKTHREGPEWLTGGAFGLEASVCAMIVATVAGTILLMRARRNGAFLPPLWRRQTKE